jgi:hypothetical protein
MKISVRSEKVINPTDKIKLAIDYTKTSMLKTFPFLRKCLERKPMYLLSCFISNDAIFKMDEASYHPATLMELLVLGILFPELQKQFLIVKFGSVWHLGYDNRFVPGLVVRNSKRELGLYWSDDDWSVRYRFFGVRK